MFTDDNAIFLAGQRPGTPEYNLAAGAAEQLMADLGRTHSVLPYYFRIDIEAHAALLDATKTLVQAQEKLLRHLCTTHTSAELVAMFGIPHAMARLMDWSAAASSGLRMVRADIVPAEDGYYFCELNHFSGVGGGEGYHSAVTFAEILGHTVSGLSPFRHLALQYVAKCRQSRLTRVVILDSSKHRRYGWGEHKMLTHYLRIIAPDLETAYHDETNYPQAWLRPEEASRTLVHRLITFDDTPDEGAFLGILHECGVTFSCFMEAELKMHRKWFSMLHAPQYNYLLSSDERATVSKYVPHTFDLTGDNLDETLKCKDTLVFKRSFTHGGAGVLMGDQTSAQALRDTISGEPAAWVAQRRVRSSTLTFNSSAPLYFVLGVFLYGDNAAGLLVRASKDPAVNTSQGGGASWAFPA